MILINDQVSWAYPFFQAFKPIVVVSRGQNYRISTSRQQVSYETV